MYLRELDRTCMTPACTAVAVVEIFTETHETVGRFCRKDGAQRLRHGSEAERAAPFQKPTYTTEAGRR